MTCGATPACSIALVTIASYSSSDGTSTRIGSSAPGLPSIARNELLALALRNRAHLVTHRQLVSKFAIGTLNERRGLCVAAPLVLPSAAARARVVRDTFTRADILTPSRVAPCRQR